MEIGHRPWGSYYVLYNGDECKVKKIVIDPGQQISYQYHYKRNERWSIISGNGIVTLDDEDILVSAESSVYIPAMTKHMIRNPSETEPIIFIEVQTGTYFGEDDIVRLRDSYGRV